MVSNGNSDGTTIIPSVLVTRLIGIGGKDSATTLLSLSLLASSQFIMFLAMSNIQHLILEGNLRGIII